MISLYTLHNPYHHHYVVCLRQVHSLFQIYFSRQCDLSFDISHPDVFNGILKIRMFPSNETSLLYIIDWPIYNICGPGSSVGIATEVRAGRSGIESRWVRDFPPVQTGPGAHPASYKMGTGSFPVVECGRNVLLTTRALLVPRSWKSTAIPLPTLWATPGL